MASTKSKGTSHVVYYKDGSVWARGRMDGRVPTGYWEWFRKDGTRMGAGTFENGEKVGTWTRYDKNGKAEKVTTFKKRPK